VEKVSPWPTEEELAAQAEREANRPMFEFISSAEYERRKIAGTLEYFGGYKPPSMVDPGRAKRLIERDRKAVRRMERERARCPEKLVVPAEDGVREPRRLRCEWKAGHLDPHVAGGISWPI
jgi:hypothetical protein